MTHQVLLIEDDEALRASLAQSLELEGIEVIPAVNFIQAKRNVRANFSGVVLSDIRMPEKDGFDVLAYVRSVDQDLPVILLTGEADVPTALRAMREGAYDFLEKPCTTEELIDVLTRALEHRALVLKTRKMERQLQKNDAAAVNFPGSSQAVRTLRAALRQAADMNRHVHLTGPAGAGKRIGAYTLYRLSSERTHFTAISLLTHSGDLPEIETDTQVADVSIKNLDLATAYHQDQIFRLAGSPADLRLITSSRLSFNDVAAKAGFSDELIAALNPVEIEIPSLAQRKADLPAVFEELLRQSVRNLNGDMPVVPQSVMSEVMTREWPGNLSELRNYAKAFALRSNVATDVADTAPLADQIDAFERTVLMDTLKKTNGSASKAAEALGVPRKTFYDRLARYDIRPKDYKADGTGNSAA